MYVPLQVNRFPKIILLVFQYKYLKSGSGDFNSPESAKVPAEVPEDSRVLRERRLWFPASDRLDT